MTRALSGAAALLILGSACSEDGGAPPVQPTAQATSRGPFFEDATADAGLRFQHEAGRNSDYFMPDSIGSGAAFFDYDNDGRLDLYLVQCGGTNSSSGNQLFHQEADGSFRNVSDASGLAVKGHGMGACAGDVNNDGFPDLLVTEYKAARLFLNLGNGMFREITASAGLDNPRWATAASFLDFDRDGWLDIVVANYVDYAPTRNCVDPGGEAEFCGPQNFEGTVARLFRNLGEKEGARFQDVTIESGLVRATGPALGILCADFDGNHWPDIFIADDGKPNRLFLNQQNGTFVDSAALRGLAYNSLGMTVANMGVAFGDVNADGLMDLFVTHLAQEQHALWRQGPAGFFQDQTAEFGLANPRLRGTGFGTVLSDFDCDGALDLAFVNGLIRRGRVATRTLPGLLPFWSAYAQPFQIFASEFNGRFQDVSSANAAFCGYAAVGRGLASGDVDNDGDTDLLAISAGGPARLFKNVAKRSGHWIAIRAVDPALGGRDAIGAEIVVQAGRAFWGMVQPSSSYLSSNDPRVHFGLGGESTISSVKVRWPDGNEELFSIAKVDQHVTVRKGAGRSP